MIPSWWIPASCANALAPQWLCSAQLCAGDFREHAACTKEFFEPDSRRDSETFFAHREGDYHFLERSVTRALADPVMVHSI